ncbi:PQQ-like domain-containing protein [Chitinophaga terrae (ex Kim and Jung 2007)]|uniref:PQQ-like domain-containing protein n=1 Tax=Chitinophaga terrae (ex Kim and Jung 2007) TaxID=408074 RepID=A0A1H4ERJ8_9BACT|nr:PQQ-binding-like beta-propeller repeat protein [Chitinophaga terrae (ex Kim and Jung 2007)]MDQ0107632.1 outer membrane protein assembly factor BamB [Chitinophaga terrae (ex Kim and Jung 2007)]GEP91782.1 hypothetical protein CTE07_34270 [Chitinophaga terrae (ex Kim and Jung 2007)]SEA86902.1 PQQ-like domain-containing protein [Chitinophaga terrae (ex Kim and Jung 2007)]
MKLLFTIDQPRTCIPVGNKIVIAKDDILTAYNRKDLTPAWSVTIGRDFYYLIGKRLSIIADKHVRQYDPETGKLVLERVLDKRGFCYAGPDAMVMEEPCSNGSKLLQKINLVSGDIVWSTHLPPGTDFFISNDDVLVVLDGEKTLTGIDLHNGNKIWSVAFSLLLPDAVINSGVPPETYGDYFYVFTEKREMVQLEMRTGQLMYVFPSETVLAIVPTFFGQHVYFSSVSKILELNVAGQVSREIEFTPYITGAPFYFRTYVAVNDNYILLANSRTCEVLVFDKHTGAFVTSFCTGDENWYIRGYVFTASGDQLFVGMMKTGDVIYDRLNIYSLKPGEVG